MAFRRACPVCGYNFARILFRPMASPGAVARCPVCGMIYVAEAEDCRALILDGPVLYEGITPHTLHSACLGDVADSWEFRLLPDKECEWPALQRNAHAALARLAPHRADPHATGDLLDMGSGWGFFLAVAEECGWNTHGLEPLPASSVYARAAFGLHIVTDTLHEGTYPPASFDVITAFQVFEHLPHPWEDARILYRLLRPGGLLLVEVPNFATWTMHLLGPKHRHFTPDHLNFFTAATLDRLLRAQGFGIVDHYHPTRYMSGAYFLHRWLPTMLPASFVAPLQHVVRTCGLGARMISLNVGDILAVIARKPQDQIPSGSITNSPD